MGSENNITDEIGFQQSDAPIPCATGCGFFGSLATMNLCSKCYRDHCLKEDQSSSAKAAVEKSMSSSISPAILVVPEDQKPPTLPAGQPSIPPLAKPTNRCCSCNKKVGVMGFKCRCGSTFCGSHRYPEEHDCSFDFKNVGRDAIAKENPVVKADKLQRF